MNDSESDAHVKRGRKRRRASPLWRSTRMRVVVGLLVLAPFVAGAWWWSSGRAATATGEAADRVITGAAALGFAVEEILLAGREKSARASVMKAIGLRRGHPLFGFDPESVRRRLERLPWVRSATVRRMLPGSVVVELIERQPLAIWQHKGAFSLVDAEGAVIERASLEGFGGLLTVVGKDAPGHAAELIDVLAGEPEVMMRTKAAVWVAERRWNLHLENGVVVQLPEVDPASAVARLAAYERDHGVLEQGVAVLDLRLPDRLIVRTERQAPPSPVRPGQRT